ncbi:MAG TPA: type II toxin-antitoxin system RatA family toxin [Steroidobacteraceae bacterium]|nr:type II toxin-antitoxin system RatA family toxin [Steroidobacteraceae bacterium]
MREVRRNALVPYTPAQMYALVNDVARYPEFVPWCPATRIHAETAETITATVEIERAGVRIGLTTRNAMRPGERIEMSLVDGPLRSFGGTWDFVPIRAAAAGEVRGCRVELAVSFEFRSAALGLVLGPVFESSWDSLVDAFVRRAREVYRG